jgi:hypothetical protein
MQSLPIVILLDELTAKISAQSTDGEAFGRLRKEKKTKFG